MLANTQAAAIRDYCNKFLNKIAVREQVNGKWGSFFLSELSTALRNRHIQRFVDMGVYPIKLN